MKYWNQYKLGLERRKRRFRAMRKVRELENLSFKMANISPDAALCFVTLRNELIRLPYFLKYYRDMGVQHFCIVDNGSTDGGRAYLLDQSDVSLWHTDHSYKRSKFGMDWLNALMSRHASGHWCVVVDVDEFLVYPYQDTRGLNALTDWLDDTHRRSFGTMLLDMYPKGAVSQSVYKSGQNPMEVASYFDAGNYTFDRNPNYGNLWIQGGVRQRMFFADRPAFAPALNKIPLVKWDRKNAFVSSTHNMLPRSLNTVYDHKGGQRASGVLLHTKFMHMFADKASEELLRKQHYAASREYKSYAASSETDLLWTPNSARYRDWRQLCDLGLMSAGGWG